jgi:hypothetical protein
MAGFGKILDSFLPSCACLGYHILSRKKINGEYRCQKPVKAIRHRAAENLLL